MSIHRARCRWTRLFLLGLSVVFLVVPDADGADLTQDEILEIRERAGESSFQRLRAEWEQKGDNHRLALEAAIAIGGEEGLDLAREALRIDRPDYSASDASAVINAMNDYKSPEALEVLRDHALSLQYKARSEPQNLGALDDLDGIARAWAGVYFRGLGANDAAYARAARDAADGRLSTLDRALRLRTFVFVGRGPDGPARELALETYRPYLEHPDSELRMAALSVNSSLWDWEVIPQLKKLADAPRDPWVRRKSQALVARYLASGPDRPRPGQSVISPTWRAKRMRAWDPEGARAWADHYDEWRAEQHLLLTGEPLPPPLPDPPSVPLFGTSEGGDPPPARTLPGRELPERP